MAWFTREKSARPPGPAGEAHRVRTEGLWLKCDSCRQIIWRKALDENLQVCPKCDFHFRIDTTARLRILFDAPWETFDANLVSTNPLGFVDSKPYSERLAGMREEEKLGFYFTTVTVEGRGGDAGRSAQLAIKN